MGHTSICCCEFHLHKARNTQFGVKDLRFICSNSGHEPTATDDPSLQAATPGLVVVLLRPLRAVLVPWLWALALGSGLSGKLASACLFQWGFPVHQANTGALSGLSSCLLLLTNTLQMTFSFSSVSLAIPGSGFQRPSVSAHTRPSLL